MRDLESFKRAHGPEAGEDSDADIERLQRELNVMAELLLDLYWSERRGNKTRRRTTD